MSPINSSNYQLNVETVYNQTRERATLLCLVTLVSSVSSCQDLSTPCRVPSKPSPARLATTGAMTRPHTSLSANGPILAAQYVRMSTEHQQYSIDNQSDEISAYAKANNMEVVRTYTDAGKSGLTIENRPGLRQMIADVEAGAPGFSAILVYDISRWGRFQDADESAFYEYRCRRANIAVHYCTEPFSNDGSPSAALLKTIKRTMAAEYSRELSAKVFAGQAKLTELGVTALGLATAAAVAAARRIEWSPLVLRGLAGSAIVLTLLMLAIATGTIVWWVVMADFAPGFLGNGLLATSNVLPPALLVAMSLMLTGLMVAAIGTVRIVQSNAMRRTAG